MSWWGKALGGAFGFMIGGPLGALMGIAFGHSFDRGIHRINSASQGGCHRRSPGGRDDAPATFVFAGAGPDLATDLADGGYAAAYSGCRATR